MINKMNNQAINEKLKNYVKSYVTSMVNPNYEKSSLEYHGLYDISFLKGYIEENKQEIDIKALKEYLELFDIRIFNEHILNIEKQLAARLAEGEPKTFEEDLELLFKEKAFTLYATHIYEIPRIAKNRIAKILKKYNQPIEQLVDNNLLARLAITTTTKLIHNGETDLGYPYQSNYEIGGNFLALEIIKEVLKNTSKQIKDVKIGNNKPFENSIVLKENQKLYVETGNASKTVFQTLSQIIYLYSDFQYGSSHSFSEDYYSEGLGVLNLCLNKMIIKPKLTEILKPEVEKINKFLKENIGHNVHKLKQINNQCIALYKNLDMPTESGIVSKFKLN